MAYERTGTGQAMRRPSVWRRGRLLLLTALALAPALAQAPRTRSAPSSRGPSEAAQQADSAAQVERDRPTGWALAEHRRLDRALRSIQAERPGVVDAYVVTVALDSEPVFVREAREAGRVLARRYDAAGRTIVLAGPDGSRGGGDDLPRGSPETLAAVLARVAEVMDRRQDVLVLYTTSHGAPFGIVYADGDRGAGAISPAWLRRTLGELHIANRLLIISACFSGVFVPVLADADTAIITAAAANRTSFGCVAENDWTFFGDAMINHGLRDPVPLSTSFAEARRLVGGWEGQGKLIPSNPQVAIGRDVAKWLTPLEDRMPRTTSAPVGRPAADALDDARRNNH